MDSYKTKNMAVEKHREKTAKMMALTVGWILAVILAIMATDSCRKSLMGQGWRAKETKENRIQATHAVDFRHVRQEITPCYLDLDVGDRIRITKSDNAEIIMQVADVQIENRALKSPLTRVTLEIDGREHPVYCGMIHPKKGGVAPIEVDGIKIAVEITRLLFSEIVAGKSPFNNYANFQLQKDLRLAIWEGKKSNLSGMDGVFVVQQPRWTRDRYGPWLHKTSYGIHSAIDIFSTRHGTPEAVISPEDGIVYKVYNRDADENDRKKSKAINLYSIAEACPGGGKIFFRFHHLSRIFVSPGEQVKRGQVLGLTGHTGFRERIGDHLHFEIRLNPVCFGRQRNDNIFASVPVNPYPYLLEWWENSKRSPTAASLIR